MSEVRRPEMGDAPLEGEEFPEVGDDEPGDEPRPEEGEPEAPPEPERAERAPRRDQNQRLREQRQELIRRNADLEARLARIEQAQRQPPADPAAAQAAEQARWNAYRQAIDAGQMSPVDVIREIYQYGQQTFQQQLAAQQAALNDRIDRQAYESAAVTSKLHRDYAPRVEEMLAAERAAGNFGVNRPAILKYLVGEDAIARSQAGAPLQRRQAAQRVSGQQVRPANAAGDGARPLPREARDADAELLRSITINDI